MKKRTRAEARKEEKEKPRLDQPMQSLEDLQNEILSGLEVQAEEEEKPTNTIGPGHRVGRCARCTPGEQHSRDGHQEGRQRHPHRAAGKGRRAAAAHGRRAARRKRPFQEDSAAAGFTTQDSFAGSTFPNGAFLRTDAFRSGSTTAAIDFRVSTVPAKFGEKIVMRILDKSGSLLPLDKIIVHGADRREVAAG